MNQCGVDEDGYKHLESLVANPTLNHINDIKTASIWNGQNLNACLDVIEQSLTIKGKRGCETELRLREILKKHMERVLEQEKKTKAPSPFNNQIINGVRWRQ